MTEGGGTPKFSEAVSNIIAEDRSIEPLITGLINVSGLLANVAAHRHEIHQPLSPQVLYVR
jgi:hypothetical protein